MLNELPPVPASANKDEALYLLDDNVYLHIQRCDDGWDYTMMDKEDQAVVDGGVIDNPNLTIADLVRDVQQNDLAGRVSVKLVPLEVLD